MGTRQKTQYGVRLEQAKKHGGFDTDAELAEAVSRLAEKDIPTQTIQKLRQSTYSVYTPHIAHACNVRAIWLAIGSGNMTERTIVAPKHLKLIEDFKSLPRDCQETVLGLIRLLKRMAGKPDRKSKATG